MLEMFDPSGSYVRIFVAETGDPAGQLPQRVEHADDGNFASERTEARTRLSFDSAMAPPTATRTAAVSSECSQLTDTVRMPTN